MSPRRLSAALAVVVEQLEYEQASYVTLERVGEIAREHGIKSAASDLAWRLRREGWLLATPVAGVFEFAPAAHAGPYGRGDDWAVLKGSLERRPGLDVRACLVSALWLMGLSERAPSTHEVCGPAPGSSDPVGLAKVYRRLRFASRLGPVLVDEVPLEDPATLLVHVAAHPTHVSSWDAIENALPVLATRTDVERLAVELEGRSQSTAPRLAYLLSGVAPEVAEKLRVRRPRTTIRVGTYGPGAPARYNSQWNVADSLIPFDPAMLRWPNPVTSGPFVGASDT